MLDTNQKILIGVAIVIVLGFAYYYYCYNKGKSKREAFTYDAIALNAKNYTFIPSKNCNGCNPPARPDFAAMTCNDSNLPKELMGMSKDEIKSEIDLYYRKPMEMVDTKDLLPETDLSGLSYGVDPAEDFANKFVWNRTTFARVKRKNWECGAAMIRGDLIIDPGKQSWFQHDNDYRDLTPGFIPKQYCGEIDVEDLSYNMNQYH